MFLHNEGNGVGGVQADLADGDTASGKRFQADKQGVINQVGVHGMDAKGWEDALLATGKSRHPLPIGGMHPGHHEGGHPGATGVCQDPGEPIGKDLLVQVAMGIDQDRHIFGLQMRLVWIHCFSFPRSL